MNPYPFLVVIRSTKGLQDIRVLTALDIRMFGTILFELVW